MGETTRPVLLVIDICRIWTEERRRRVPNAPQIQPATVWSYRKESVRDGGRYQQNPMPEPDGYLGRGKKMPYWLPGRESEIRQWFTGRAAKRRRAD